MNKKLIRNIEKQKNLRKKKEEIEIELQLLAEEQEEIENLEVIKEFRSRKISLDEFLFIVRKNKEEENRERQEQIQMKVRKIYEKNNQWDFSCNDATCKSSEYIGCKSCICKNR